MLLIARKRGLFFLFIFSDFLLFFLRLVFFLESFHASGRIDNLLLAGHEGVTVGTNFYFDVFFG